MALSCRTCRRDRHSGLPCWASLTRVLALALLSMFLVPLRVAWADVWAYVDDKGVAHFATSQLDARYHLFARVDESPLKAKNVPASPSLGLSKGPSEASTMQKKKLLALFDKSPDYASVRTLLREASIRHEVNYELLQAVMATESGFNRYAVSPKGAVGLMQVMPATAERFGLKPSASQSVEKRLFDPALNIDAGTRYLRYLNSLFPRDTSLVLAAYNAGEGAVQRAGNRIPNYPETQQYVKTVLQMQQLLQGSGSGAAPQAGAGDSPAKSTMMVPGQVSGRSNMVQGLSSRTGRIVFQMPVEPADDTSVK